MFFSSIKTFRLAMLRPYIITANPVGADMPERLRSELVEQSATKSPWGTSAIRRGEAPQALVVANYVSDIS
jgi:hypothetical protein